MNTLLCSNCSTNLRYENRWYDYGSVALCDICFGSYKRFDVDDETVALRMQQDKEREESRIAANVAYELLTGERR